jgi:tetratricopeptide (TPR) repeat protein
MKYPRNVGVGKSYFAQDVRAYYWAGVVAEQSGDADKAQRYWEDGAAIRPSPQQDPASPREGYQPEARYYKSLCLQKLGRYAEAAELF